MRLVYVATRGPCCLIGALRGKWSSTTTARGRCNVRFFQIIFLPCALQQVVRRHPKVAVDTGGCNLKGTLRSARRARLLLITINS